MTGNCPEGVGPAGFRHSWVPDLISVGQFRHRVISVQCVNCGETRSLKE